MANGKGHTGFDDFSKLEKEYEIKSLQSIVKPVVKVKRSHLRNGLLTTYFKIQDDSLTNLRVTQENRRMMKETNTSVSNGKSTWLLVTKEKKWKTTVTANLVTEGDPLKELKIMNNLLGRRKKWRLNRGDHLIQASFTVIKENDFRDFDKFSAGLIVNFMLPSP